MIGILWEKPVMMVAVRLSRYTHKLIEYSGDFTVNVPDKGMDDLVEFCGANSGRVHKKFDGIGLKTRPAKKAESHIMKQCISTLNAGLSTRQTWTPKRYFRKSPVIHTRRMTVTNSTLERS